MLVKLILDNFMSFDNETELTLVSSSKIRTMKDHKVEVKKTSILKNSIIYGANAAGKSNLIEGLDFMKYCILKSIPAGANSVFCKSVKSNEKKESLFEVIICVNNKFYTYGFSLIAAERRLINEWLYEMNQNGQSSILFEKKEKMKPILGDKINLTDADKLKFATYLEDYDENSNVLFLTFMNKDKKYSNESKLIFFKEIFNWFSNKVEIYSPNSPITNFSYYYDVNSLTKVNELIKIFDTGIDEVKIVEISQDEFKSEVPEPLYFDIMENIKLSVEKNMSPSKLTLRAQDSFFSIDIKEDGVLNFTTIKTTHKKSEYSFDFREESDGTQRLFDLMDMLLGASNDKVYLIDELERSLHPKLTFKFIELFNQMNSNKRNQLIFSTHESTIMDQNLFRRDEIWFVEKNKENTSEIYSLDKFKERYDKVLGKAYLEGRYGALPVFQKFSFKEE